MVKFELEEYHRNVTEKELIADLKRVALETKKPSITHKEYNQYGRFNSSTIFRKFGSWLGALNKAGLKRTRHYGIANEELFKNLEEIWIKLGRQPYYRDIRKPLTKYSGRVYLNRFGTWREALGKFIEQVNQKEVITLVKDTKNSNLNQESINKHETKRDISWRLRFIVIKRDNFKCKSCGRSPATDPKIILHVDHVIPYAKDGETVLENLQTLCSVCNIGKSNLTI